MTYKPAGFFPLGKLGIPLLLELVMKRFLGLFLAVAAGSAYAHGCPGEMKAIDAKLPSVKLADAQMNKVKELRVKGEQLHKEGKHSESMAALGEAKKLLGP